ncbi:MAG: pyruvate dehydrogenase (acetyl-transferring) E1 component subunit alpha [Candidatus Rokubacteria bacterium]|nr:pyruvate dehydrogenase (acetyl-transferring) E1 component subunit alpha [Candidatus Rokubacteria bacterium]MBI2199297.1 pyruvate dehydrogenase (acetyl-transferring) E1 component subunit alpha [Candidatus Rokubacteria bacterium]
MAQATTTILSPRLDAALARRLLGQMALIRRFEEKAAEMYALGKIGGFLHLYIGQEAVAVGATSTLRPDDYAVSSYREHGHCLAKGSDPRRMMAELFGRRDGLSKGKGGSMHLFDKSVNFLGGHGIVGAHLPLAAGAGFAINYQGGDQVVLCFFGDGAVHEGEFHEAMNLVALWKLPVIYICENNRYAMGTAIHRALAQTEIWRFAETYGIHGEAVDGMDVLAVRECVGRVVERARRDKTPALIEARTYRFRGHSMRDPAGAVYRTREEVEREKQRDPIALLSARGLKDGVLSEADVRAIEQNVADAVDEAVAFAEASPEPPASFLFTDVYKD